MRGRAQKTISVSLFAGVGSRLFPPPGIHPHRLESPDSGSSVFLALLFFRVLGKAVSAADRCHRNWHRPENWGMAVAAAALAASEARRFGRTYLGIHRSEYHARLAIGRADRSRRHSLFRAHGGCGSGGRLPL